MKPELSPSNLFPYLKKYFVNAAASQDISVKKALKSTMPDLCHKDSLKMEKTTWSMRINLDVG